MNRSTKFDRRQFLQSGMRYGLLMGMAAMGVAAETKRRRLENDPNCVRIWTCADCAEFGQCSKPKAQEFEQTQTRHGGQSTHPADNGG